MDQENWYDAWRYGVFYRRWRLVHLGDGRGEGSMKSERAQLLIELMDLAHEAEGKISIAPSRLGPHICEVTLEKPGHVITHSWMMWDIDGKRGDEVIRYTLRKIRDQAIQSGMIRPTIGVQQGLINVEREAHARRERSR
jgi:hypothetical protein